MTRARCKRRAFTLIEVLLALALLAGVMGGALGLLSDLTRRQDHIRTHSERSLDGGALVDRLERALQSSYAQNAAGEAGVRGDDHSIRVMHRGVIGHAEATGGDRRTIEMHWSETDRVVTGTFSGDGVDSASEPLARRVERLRFRYFHGARWRSSFDSVARGELPSAIEISIWFEPAINAAPETRTPDAGFDDVLFPDDASDLPTRSPDRVRIMVVPDAPGASWEVGG